MRIALEPGLTLEGILDLPELPDSPGTASLLGRDAALVCHPHPAFGGRMSTPLVVALARACVASGMPTLRFHYRGIEGSDGEATGGLEEEGDLLAATRFLMEAGARRVAWLGYSFGALMAWKAIAGGARPLAYVGIALPTTIIGDDPVRLADAARAAQAEVPGLLLSGDQDPLCDADRLTHWTAKGKHMRVERLPGEAHVFSSVGSHAVVERALAFVAEARG